MQRCMGGRMTSETAGKEGATCQGVYMLGRYGFSGRWLYQSARAAVTNMPQTK